jgi:hypothetical protein
MTDTKKYLVGMFDDDDVLMSAVDNIRAAGQEITDVFTPFPVHGLEHKLGLRPTRLHTAGFMFGATGTLTALGFITWISTKNYPNVFGGKPFFALPAWIPITFELTVLFASVGMVVAFYYLNNMWPGKQPKIFDKRTTDHMFAMVFELDGSKGEGQVKKLTEMLKKNGAVEEPFIKEL